MIVVDTSAVVAIYSSEPEAAQFFEIIASASQRVLPPSCLVEFILLRRIGGDRKTWMNLFIGKLQIQVASFTPTMASVAVDAAERYGRGSRHPARLNFGDCLSYAVARNLNLPLLYKGEEFSHTDIESALAT
jgi:ribonuclease VapC